MQVTQERDNPLLKRRELWLELAHAGKATPPRKELLPLVASQLKAAPEALIIDKIFSHKGLGASRIKVFAYASPQDVPPQQKLAQDIRLGLAQKPKAEAKAKK